MNVSEAAVESPRRTQQERRHETERRVVDAAITLIASHGSHLLTLAQVGAAAGYSRGIVYHHFGNRAGLLAAVMHDLGGVDVPEYSGDGLGRVAGMVERYLRNIAGRAATTKAFVRLWAEAMSADPILAPLFDERDIRFRALVAGLVREGVVDGSITATVDADVAAVLVLGLARGVGVQLMSPTPPESPLQAMVDAARRAIVMTLRSPTSLPPSTT
ncbi:TetR/AcrR family transcriptional regulator [Mycobacterium sp. AT1]|uniref:TetR/AcrR family transcriptional regulator n=1 Tax=Mycobacterium sp. AT1 TaxID=1961706 RepID=UPI0009ADFC7F|nr:TetR/AcrR family transcriptional regulator [Mycobacterium sp. AT1]OPX05579.1 hypothetical protein B1790_31525 [Mycobacterium sp. AT1]